MLNSIKIKKGTNKIAICGNKDNEFIKAYSNLSKEMKEELNKVLDFTIFDSFNLSICEWENSL